MASDYLTFTELKERGLRLAREADLAATGLQYAYEDETGRRLVPHGTNEHAFACKRELEALLELEAAML